MNSSVVQTLLTFLIGFSTLWTLFFGTVGIYDKLRELKKVRKIDWITKLVALLRYTFIIISVVLAICVLILSTTLLMTLSHPTGTQAQVNATATATQARVNATATAIQAQANATATATQTQVNATATAQANATATAIAMGPPTHFVVTTVTLKSGLVLQSGQPIPIQEVPLTITGTDTSPGSGYVWVVVEDRFGNYYLQHPAVRFDDNGQWTVPNIVTALGTVKIDFVYVTAQGHATFLRMVATSAYGAFYQLPDGSKVLKTIDIVVSQ